MVRSQEKGRRAALVLKHYRWLFRGVFALQILALFYGGLLHRKMEINRLYLHSIVVVTLPTILSGFLGAAGKISVATELALAEALLFGISGVILPLYILLFPLTIAELGQVLLCSLTGLATWRAFLSHIKVLHLLAQISIWPFVITLGPLIVAIWVRISSDKAIPPEWSTTFRRSIIYQIFGILLHHYKMVDMEELLVELKALLEDRTQLIQSAFDATFYVKVVPVSALHSEGAVGLHGLAGAIQVTKSSAEMDKLCCCSMASSFLTSRRVPYGLANLTEVVMRTPDAAKDPLLARTMSTFRDEQAHEFDCEVRAVMGSCSTMDVLVGVRQMGEKRGVIAEEEQSDVPEEPWQPPEEPQQAAGAGLRASLERRLQELWHLLFAEPAPEPSPPVAEALWRALDQVSKVLLLKCELPHLEIMKATSTALQELPGPVVGLTVPSFIVCSKTAQAVRVAAKACWTKGHALLASMGCYCGSFGEVSLRSASGPTGRALLTFILIPSASEKFPEILLLFNRLPRSVLRSIRSPSSTEPVDGTGPKVGPRTRSSHRKPMSWASELEEHS